MTNNNNLPLVSVLAHTRNSERTLQKHLQSIKEQTYLNIEVIVVDNNSTDRTKKIAQDFTDKIYNKGPERSAQRNYAAKKACGKYLIVPDSDMYLTPNVIAECVEICEENQGIAALVIPEKSVGIGFWAKVKAFERSFYLSDPTIEAARFFRKSVFWEFNGYDENLTGPEDWDLPERIAQKYRIGRIKNYIEHDEGRLTLKKLVQRKYYYAFKVAPYLEKWGKGPINQKTVYFLRPSLYKNIPRMIAHPVLGLAVLLMLTCELFAGAAGYIQSRVFRLRYGKNPY